MVIPALSNRIGVCSWSLRPTGAAQLIFHLQGLGLNRFQVALDPIREHPRAWSRLAELCQDQDLTMVAGMFGTPSEDYSTLESIRRTGGLVPDQAWEENWRLIQQDAVIARKLGLRLVTFHAGFLPHEIRDPNYAKLLGRVRQVADLFADHGLALAMETGQETAPTLCQFLERLNRVNVGVNFDPANMILYDQGDPVEALRQLGPWVKQCHLKDATRTRTPGTWGAEVAVGAGEVDWAGFFRALKAIKFGGYLCLEREAGEQRIEDLRAGREYLRKWTDKK